ncbi:efflux transporter outer membrane subunit [Microbulbifer sp. YPW16]|uniref:efflux transporter outer membrane subunit n=1 Tax=Microbulbifer sp. YPW16 TaxID=2904242 RepID=UPI001E2A8267|nr:efflux transporter outer membrane subunit [Microbulbifer sp. YPW16]UHQ55558.1 efflux transporter outer membrane subunit [Microbulbifer sp. YPW16]
MSISRILALLLPLLTACATQPLPPGLPQQALGLPDAFSLSGEAEPGLRWWDNFRDPQMDLLVTRALADSPDLRGVLWRLQQAEATALGARSGLWPRLTGGLDHTEQRRSSNSDFDFSGGENEGGSWSGRLAASYEVDLWGRVRSGALAAEAAKLAQEESLQAAALSLAAEVAATWLQLREQWGQRELLARQLDTNRKTLRVLELRFGGGTSAAADVLQQRQLVEQSQQELDAAGFNIEILKVQLATLVGVNTGELETMVQPAAGLPALPALPDTGVPSRLLLRRPDVREAQRNLLQGHYLAKQAWAERLPVISLSAIYSGGGPAISDIARDWLLTLTAAAEGVIFDGGQLSSEQQRQQAAEQEQWQLYRATVLEALSEVEQALVQEQAVRVRLEHLRERAALSDLIVERQRRAYSRGTVDFLNVLAATNDQQSLERQLLTARRELIENRVTLYRALSGGIPGEDLPPALPVELELYRAGES